MKNVKTVLSWLIFYIGLVCVFFSLWGYGHWPHLDLDQLYFSMTSPVEGVGNHLLEKGAASSLLPAAAIVLILILFLRKRDKKKQNVILSVTGFSLFFICLVVLFVRLSEYTYLPGLFMHTDFYDAHYVNPASVEIKFPEKKRNLIHVYVESLEVTFSDAESGGAFPENLIPNLTETALSNEDFGNHMTLNGAVTPAGTTWTVGGLAARSAGIPIKGNISTNHVDNSNTLLKNLVTLGDILEQEGYVNYFSHGSDMSYAGKRDFYTSHGNYHFIDYIYAKEKKLIPEDYFEFWGYEDAKLFEYSKEKITELAQSGQLFNFMILTEDTHHEDGYVCVDCPSIYQDQLWNVTLCTDKRTAEFLEWCKKQDFYENTTIVISGDHLTMDSDFCKDVDPSYQRKVYTVYINSALTRNNHAVRQYSTFDDFPTILASLGAEIEGNRLGLGVNLYSDEPTLVEQYGIKYLNKELTKQSDFISKLPEQKK